VAEILRSPVLWMVLSAAGAPVFFWLGLRRLRVARAITDLPASRVRSAAQGYVEISGIARTIEGTANIAPLTRIPSVWWYYCIEEGEHDDDDKSWRTVKTATSDASFVLHDDSGQCLVEPEGAEIFPSIRKVWYGSQDWPAPALGTENHLAGVFHRYRYTEHRIPHDSSVNVIGEFRTLRAAGGDSVAEDVSELLRKWKSDQPELLRRFDTNKDGVLSAAEWEHARQTAREHVLSELASAPPQPALNVLSAPRDGRPFLIAGIDWHKVASKAHWQSAAAWAAFVGCVGLFTWLLTRS
jgi:E3 Ubiquitin ligase